MKWAIRHVELDCTKTLIMGVVNVTPDSFSDGGKYGAPEAAVRHALRLIEQGADLIDLGAESTRPGAAEVSEEEELGRILPVLKELRGSCRVPISIDTTKTEVARQCLELGADIINDVSGLKASGSSMADAVKSFGAGLILMHRRGNPQTMRGLAKYDSVTEAVLNELSFSVSEAIRSGIEKRRLAVDPGLGFAKDAEQSLEIIRHLDALHRLELPVVLGHSRKSFIGSLTGRETDQRDFGTAAVSTYAVLKGIHILRVHDVESTRDVVRVAEKIRGENYVRTF